MSASPRIAPFPVTRWRIISQSIRTTEPTAISFPHPRKPGEPPLIMCGGSPHYMITASSFRGKLRRWGMKRVINMMQAVDPDCRITSADLRSMVLGGVKGSGKTDYLTPEQAVEVRRRRPDIEVFGINDPTFMEGCLDVGMFTSSDPAPNIHAPETSFPIVRRTLLTDPILKDIGHLITDLDSMNTLRESNRKRSQLTDALEKVRRLSRKKTLGQREKNEHDLLMKKIATLIGKEEATPEEAESFLETFRQTMRAEGQSDVSEANIQTVYAIPPGTEMRQHIHLNWVSNMGMGYFLNCWDDAWKFDPAIGGLAARGAGGYLHATYRVDRQNADGDWIEDCGLSVVPDIGVTFTGSNEDIQNSQALTAFEAWQNADISQYDFSFEALKNYISGQ